MRKQEFFDYSRRALLGASGAWALFAALRPLHIFAQASGGKLRIGIIGSGHIGGTMGGLWVKAGHPVLFSSRHPEELKELVARLGPLAQAGTVSTGDRVRRRRLFRRAVRRDTRHRPRSRRARFKARSYSMPATPYRRATARSPMRPSAKASASRRRNICPAHTSCARSTRSPTRSSPARPTVPNRSCRSRSRATMREALAVAAGLVRDAGFEPVVAGRLADARRFQRGAPGYGQAGERGRAEAEAALTP